MKQVEKASFSFDSYKIIKFSYLDPNQDTDTVSFGINPSGNYSEKNGIFTTQFDFVIKYGENNEKELLSVTMQAVFNFGGQLSYTDIPPFFFINSTGIVFPYLRAFISTLTTLANVKPLLLGLLNLSSLESVFKENIIIEK